MLKGLCILVPQVFVTIENSAYLSSKSALNSNIKCNLIISICDFKLKNHIKFIYSARTFKLT